MSKFSNYFDEETRTLSENETSPFCNHFWSLSSHGIKLRMKAVWRLEVMSNKRSGVFFQGIKPRREWLYNPIKDDPRVY